MSVSKSQLSDFAQLFEHHPALEAIQERVQQRIFKRFITASEVERKILGDTMAAGALFYKELAIIVAESKEIQDEENINE